jgi:hypothetical protein
MGCVCWRTVFLVKMEGFEKRASTAFDEYSTGFRQSLKKRDNRFLPSDLLSSVCIRLTFCV